MVSLVGGTVADVYTGTWIRANVEIAFARRGDPIPSLAQVMAGDERRRRDHVDT